MPNHRKVRPIVLDFKPSRRLTFVLGGLLFATLLIVFMVPVVGWLQLLLLVVGVPVASYVLSKDVWLCLPRSWVRLELTHQGEIKLARKNGQMELAQILPSSYVTSSLTILHLKLHTNRWHTHLLILPDSVSPASFRQLRVWLRWGLSFHLKPVADYQDLVEET